MQTSPHKTCPTCQQPAVVSMPICQRCGYVFVTREETPNSWFASPKGANARQISLVWLLSIVAAYTWIKVDHALGFILDGIAFLCAVFLTASEHPTDKANGWVKIGMELGAFISAFLLSLSHTS